MGACPVNHLRLKLDYAVQSGEITADEAIQIKEIAIKASKDKTNLTMEEFKRYNEITTLPTRPANKLYMILQDVVSHNRSICQVLYLK